MAETNEVASTPKRISEAQEQINFCNERLDLLAKTVDILKDKLSPVLRAGEQVEKTGKDGTSLTPLANQIRAIGYAVDKEKNILDEIIEMLEI